MTHIPGYLNVRKRKYIEIMTMPEHVYLNEDYLDIFVGSVFLTIVFGNNTANN